MKVVLFLLLILSVACREEEGVKLTDDELNYLRNRATLRCLSENAERFNSLKDSASSIYASDINKRGRLYTYSMKEDGSEKLKVTLKVWRQDIVNNMIYFYVVDGSKKYFLRVSLNQHEDMVDSLKSDQCDTFLKDYSVSAGSPITIGNSYKVTSGQGTEEYDDTYSIPTSEPLAFARFHLSRTLVTKNSEGVVKSTVKYTSSLTNKVEAWDVTTTSYTQLTGAQKFCEIQPNVSGSSYRMLRTGPDIFGTGYLLNPDSTTHCPTTLPSDWNLNI